MAADLDTRLHGDKETEKPGENVIEREREKEGCRFDGDGVKSLDGDGNTARLTRATRLEMDRCGTDARVGETCRD